MANITERVTITDRFKPKQNPIRSFVYPPQSEEKDAIKVQLQYLSPAIVAERNDEIRTRIVRDGKQELPQAKLQREIVNEILLYGIIKIENATFGKLAAFVPLDADAVIEAGGLDQGIPMDPTIRTNNQEARDWTLYLINESEAFRAWALDSCQTIRLFQAEDWKDRVKNSKSGRGSSSAALATTDRVTA